MSTQIAHTPAETATDVVIAVAAAIADGANEPITDEEKARATSIFDAEFPVLSALLSQAGEQAVQPVAVPELVGAR